MLDVNGHVTEEARGCVFVIRGGVAITLPVTNDILRSITRDTIIKLHREVHHIQVMEWEIDRTEFYIADEIFLSGTALAVTPVGAVDRFEIGNGTPGGVTTAVNKPYVEIASGYQEGYKDWLTPVYGN